jgi:hypothetical protein
MPHGKPEDQHDGQYACNMTNGQAPLSPHDEIAVMKSAWEILDQKTAGVKAELTFDPNEFDISDPKRWRSDMRRCLIGMKSKKAHLKRENLSDMLQDHVQQQKICVAYKFNY